MWVVTAKKVIQDLNKKELERKKQAKDLQEKLQHKEYKIQKRF